MESWIAEKNAQRRLKYAATKDAINAHRRTQRQLKRALTEASTSNDRVVAEKHPRFESQELNFLYKRVSELPTESWSLPLMPNCSLCGAVRCWQGNYTKQICICS